MIPTRDDIRLVHNVVKQAKSSFYWGMRLLPEKQREAMFALYALARHLDDIADGPESEAEKERKLNHWHGELDRLYEGAHREPLARALLPAVSYFSLDNEELHELIRGMEMDIHAPIVAPSHDTLMQYCRRVAGTVGLLSVAIFGRPDQEAKRFALALANALQLTNILRDITEDAENGRLYVPRDLLEKHGITPTTPRETIRHPNFNLVFNDLLNEARDWFEEVDAILKTTSAKGLRPAIIMMAVYRQLLENLKKRGWQVASPKLKLSKPTQAWIALRQYMVSLA